MMSLITPLGTDLFANYNIAYSTPLIKFTNYQILFPHSSQNLEPSLFPNPQLEHFPGWVSS